MRITRIYQSTSLAIGQEVVLDKDASHHLAKVLRIKIGSPLSMFNGEPKFFHGIVREISKSAVVVSIESVELVATESPLKTHLGQVLSRGDRMDFAIQKATELGVTEITPLFSERCEVKIPADKIEKKRLHWQQVAISACEQSFRTLPPIIHKPRTVESWISDLDTEVKCVLHHRSEESLPKEKSIKSAGLLIGPEGGLSESEILAAIGKGFQALTIGPRVLRTETAPIVALTLFQHYWGDAT